MTSFCIFGVSRATCKKKAEGQVTANAWPSLGRAPTIAEWAAERDRVAEELFARADRRVQVSPAFDAPQFARDWLAVDPSQVKWPLLMARGPKIDDKGNMVMKNGAPVITWLEYKEMVAA